MKKVRYAILIALGFLVIAIFTQCHITEEKTNPTNASSKRLISSGNDRGDLPPRSDESTVKIRFACHDWQASGYEKLAEVFHQRNPGIEIEISTFESDLSEFSSSNFDHTLATYQIVSSADTAAWSVTPIIVQHGMVQDLTPFMEVTSGFERQDFHPGVLELFEWNSGVWALPAEPTLLWLIVYNKDAFDKSGLGYPKPGWSYEEFQNAVKTLTIRDSGSVAQYGFVDLAMVTPYSLITGQLSTPVLDESSLTSINLVDGGVIPAVQWYVDLVNEYSILPYSGMMNEDLLEKQKEMRDLIKNGQVAMWTQLVNEVIGTEEKANIGLAPFPLSDRQGVNPMFAYGYIMSPGTAYPMESWRWINFLTHQNLGNLTKSPSSVGIPARRSVATEIEYWDRWNKDSAIVLQYALEHTFSILSHSEVREALQQVVTDILDGRQIEEALVGANAKLAETAVERERATQMPPITMIAHAHQQPEIVNSTIVFATRGFSSVPYASLARQFQEKHNTVVQIASSSTEAPPDCYVEVVSAKDIERMQVLNLQPFIDADPEFSTNNFPPLMLDVFRVHGDLRGIPTQTKMWAVFYNKEIFDKAGLPYPKAGWTLEDFVSYAIKLTQKQNVGRQYGYLHLNGDYIDLQVFIALLGTRLWDERGQPRFDSPDVISAIKWYMDLEQKYEVTPSFMESYPVPDRQIQETRNSLLYNGQVAMWTDFVGVEDSDATRWLDANVGIAPLPLGKAGGATLFLDEGFFIDKNAKDPAKCWEWLKFANSQGTFSAGIPAHQSIVTSASFISRIDRDILDSYNAMLNYARVVTPPVSAQGDLVLLFQALNEIRNGKSPHEALQQAQAQTTSKQP